ncbi:Smr/MutS family protein [Hyphomicrobium sp.]|uniref:Smr/MutS family protein n=1 Tax=Hyphomicrobium sp. TaxID=82 RepID=UPI002E307C6C|nr:Smr/MutS family protein [Hyphomicrobium sp.]HEX2840677.1 Smr/MutS family protein [Hyphomicrobium sp.]
MTKKPGPPRRRHLTNEDEALWEHTASTLKPLKGKKGRHHASASELEAAQPFAPQTKSGKKSEGSTGTGKPHAKPPLPAQAASRAVPDLNAFERKAARKLRQGQFEIEARIDLHGMRQHEAHAALRRFLMSCFGRGFRWVLVITGKGTPQRARNDDDFGMSERGVLRKNVPMWLAEPELRAVVVSYTTAAIPHGGEGALYVQLRNPDRVR